MSSETNKRPTHPLTGRPYPKDFFDVEATETLLLLTDYEIPRDVIEKWTPEQRAEAGNYAMRVHLKASDNLRVRVPPIPAFLHFPPQESR
jgi:hypothetical protein